jgi:hypothetical protein
VRCIYYNARDHTQCLRCSICNRWIQEGEMYLKVDDYNICDECQESLQEIAEYDDGYEDYINREVHERIENNERRCKHSYII